MPRDTQCERDGGVDDGIDRVGYVRGENLGTAEFLVAPVSGEPYFAEGPLFGQDDLRVKHALERLALRKNVHFVAGCHYRYSLVLVLLDRRRKFLSVKK